MNMVGANILQFIGTAFIPIIVFSLVTTIYNGLFWVGFTATSVMIFSFLLGATVLVEKVYSWPGIGTYAVKAVLTSDYSAVQGFVLIVAIIFVILNLIIDIFSKLLDPRVGYS